MKKFMHVKIVRQEIDTRNQMPPLRYSVTCSKEMCDLGLETVGRYDPFSARFFRCIHNWGHPGFFHTNDSIRHTWVKGRDRRYVCTLLNRQEKKMFLSGEFQRSLGWNANEMSSSNYSTGYRTRKLFGDTNLHFIIQCGTDQNCPRVIKDIIHESQTHSK